MAKAISKNQVSDPGPSLPSCSCFLTIFSSRIESHLVTTLVFNVNEMVRFDAFGMTSISVACKDFVDRSAMCSSPK